MCVEEVKEWRKWRSGEVEGVEEWKDGGVEGVEGAYVEVLEVFAALFGKDLGVGGCVGGWLFVATLLSLFPSSHCFSDSSRVLLTTDDD